MVELPTRSILPPGLALQPFSQNSRTPTVAKEFQIGLYDPAEADLELCCNNWSAGFLGERLYLLVFPQPRPGGVLRAIPTTSAPSHFRYTLRHEAETCLFLMEMGPQDFSVNAIDPFLVFNGHD